MVKDRLKTFLALVCISIGLALPLIGFTSRLAVSAAAVSATGAPSIHFPTPTYDPLLIPELPPNPSDFELGKYQYYYDCMPCHGDLGQGLTDAFRMVWVEDHRNCWARGCHAGRREDEGFPIPTIVPAVIATDDALRQFPDLSALEQFLHDTHPPQYPGKLPAKHYHAFAVYLWVENHKPRLTPTPLDSPTVTATPAAAASMTPTLTASPPPTSSVAAHAVITTPALETTALPGMPAAAQSPGSSLATKTPQSPGLLMAALALFTLAVFALAAFFSRPQP